MVCRLLSYQVEAFGMTDCGLVRSNNEDTFAVLEDSRCYLLADGMGGHKAGEVASYEVTRFLGERLSLLVDRSQGVDAETLQEEVAQAFVDANTHVYALGQRLEECQGMGTTVCCALFHDASCIYSHIGDSRIYLWRERQLRQLTKDHSLVNELIDQGKLDKADEELLNYKNVITRAVGIDMKVQASVDSLEVQRGDVYLMCSDGLTDYVPEEVLWKELRQTTDLEHIAKALIQQANQAGGHDNITVVLVRVQ